MKKQTATEWLFAHLLPFLNDNGFADPLENEHFFKCLAEAKLMEKKQMIQFGESVCQDGFEEYVAETFDKTYGGEQ